MIGVLDWPWLVMFVALPVSAFALGMLFRDNRKSREIERKHESLGRLRAAVELEEKKLKHAVSRAEEYERAKKFLDARPKLEAERGELIKKIAAGETRLDEVRGDVKRAEDVLARLRAELGGLEEEKRKRAGALRELDGERERAARDLERVRAEIGQARKDREALGGELAALREKMAAAERECADAQTKVTQVAARMDRLRQEEGALTAGIERKKRELERQNAKLEENRGKLARLEDIEMTIGRKQKQIESLDERIRARDEQLKALSADLSETMKTIAGGIDRLNRMNLSGVQTLRQAAFDGLRERVFDLRPGAEAVAGPGDEGEKKALRAVAEHFREVGFAVPPRLLRAFHTSLKTSDMSSLTVMAGVSGTGKSALPKLYAEAMGICFQPLAVEPRWDSPKDLLGFFNYVTNRYEPTLLARALFQFQGGWSGNGKGGFRPDVDLHDYMFMPMLDEMNLARIEYYFSEFLSKLEMRRLEASLTEGNCRRVALEVFQGYEGADRGNGRRVVEKAIRIFANTNTLFVGTMNEDETTQSLSDKVIDRANVLYFGRPKKLQPKVPSVPEEGGGRGVGLLPLATWDSWRRKAGDMAGDGVLETAEKTLEMLNGELAKFNRPFAHRTYQAMLSYIANYPGAEGRNPALADQIGMRIMPKLRGLDLSQHQETLRRIGGIIRRLDDRLLTGAFNRASRQEENRTGFFEWTGFDWDDGDGEG